MDDSVQYPRCKECGCLDICADGSVLWDHEAMEWELSGDFEGEFCADCSGEEIEWVNRIVLFTPEAREKLQNELRGMDRAEYRKSLNLPHRYVATAHSRKPTRTTMNKPYPGILKLNTPRVQQFKLEGALPSGTVIMVDWVDRTLNLEYPSDTPSLPDSSHRDKYKEELLAHNEAAGDEVPQDPEPELPMEHTTTVDPTKDQKYIIMDADGWSHAPNGVGITKAQHKAKSPLIGLLNDTARIVDKVKQPSCCYAVATFRGKPDTAVFISGQLSQLFWRGLLRRKKYHCGCKNVACATDKALFHYQLMSGVGK